MKLSNNAIEVLVTEIAGKDVLPLIELIRGKTDVSEFKIAEKLGKTVNEVRNMLYRLSDYNLVSFTRKKDKRKGWYIYFWTLNSYQSLILLKACAVKYALTEQAVLVTS